jgi:hypothetical protein
LNCGVSWLILIKLPILRLSLILTSLNGYPLGASNILANFLVTVSASFLSIPITILKILISISLLGSQALVEI